MFQVEFELDRIIKEAIELKASDIHFDTSAPIRARCELYGFRNKRSVTARS